MLVIYTLVVLSLMQVNRCEEKEKEQFFPSYITPCTYKSKEFDDCVKIQIEKSLPVFTKGVPELNVDSLDPVNLKDINIDASGLKLSFTQAKMHGLSKSKLRNFTVSLGHKKEKFSLGFKVDLSLTAKYTIDGRILILPIQGKGDALVEAKGVEVKIDSTLVHFSDDKGQHLKLQAPEYKYTIERTIFDLKNLFNGNKALAETTLKFANENWQQLMDELAPPVIKQIVKAAVKVINKFFSGVTINQMIVGYTEDSDSN